LQHFILWLYVEESSCVAPTRSGLLSKSYSHHRMVHICFSTPDYPFSWKSSVPSCCENNAERTSPSKSCPELHQPRYEWPGSIHNSTGPHLNSHGNFESSLLHTLEVFEAPRSIRCFDVVRICKSSLAIAFGHPFVLWKCRVLIRDSLVLIFSGLRLESFILTRGLARTDDCPILLHLLVCIAVELWL
jgi:hypothetical protein